MKIEDNLLLLAVLMALGVYATLWVFMWLGDVALYYLDAIHRARYGRPRFWPFVYRPRGVSLGVSASTSSKTKGEH